MSGPGINSVRWRTLAAAAAVALVALSWLGVAIAAMFFQLSKVQLILVVAAAALVTEGALYVGAVFLGLTLFQRVRARLRLRFRSRR